MRTSSDSSSPAPAPPTPIARRLVRQIAESGPIPFATFMAEALYGDGGYYRRPAVAIGEAGDYVTGSSLSPLFGRATARLLQRLDGALGRPAGLLEAGYGSGAHLAAVVDGLAGAAGTDRRLVGWDQQARPLPAEVAQVTSLDDLAAGKGRVGPLDGLVFSYELFDALPVHRLIRREDGSLGELFVALTDAGRALEAGEAGEAGEEAAAAAAESGDPAGPFCWQEGELSDPALADLLAAGDRGAAGRSPAEALAVGQVADLAPGWVPLYRRLASCLERGLLVTCDYGFERRRLLDPRVRRHGTLACYSRQRLHRNPFVLVGEQDLTAHVDFSALIAAGEEAGLTTVALTRQALWLAACGLFDELAGGTAEESGGAPVGLRRQALALLDGSGMGEEIRVLVQARGVDAAALFDLPLAAR